MNGILIIGKDKSLINAISPKWRPTMVDSIEDAKILRSESEEALFVINLDVADYQELSRIEIDEKLMVIVISKVWDKLKSICRWDSIERILRKDHWPEQLESALNRCQMVADQKRQIRRLKRSHKEVGRQNEQGKMHRGIANEFRFILSEIETIKRQINTNRSEQSLNANLLELGLLINHGRRLNQILHKTDVGADLKDICEVNKTMGKVAKTLSGNSNGRVVCKSDAPEAYLGCDAIDLYRVSATAFSLLQIYAAQTSIQSIFISGDSSRTKIEFQVDMRDKKINDGEVKKATKGIVEWVQARGGSIQTTAKPGQTMKIEMHLPKLWL